MSLFSGLSTLVVEDNPNMRQLIVKMLRIFGVSTIHQADEGGKAVSLLSEHPVDLVITDWNMAPVDGMAVAEWVRMSPESPDPYLPIVMISSLSEESRIAHALNAGINAFLPKPINPQDILITLKDIVYQPRPFIRTNTYFGPDRRRALPPPFDGVDRRKVDVVPRWPEEGVPLSSNRSRPPN